MSLENVDLQELLDEVARREKLEKESEKPKPKDNIDWSQVLQYAVEQVDELDKVGYHPEDWKQYTWEAVMIAVFGEDYFTWHNKQL